MTRLRQTCVCALLLFAAVARGANALPQDAVDATAADRQAFEAVIAHAVDRGDAAKPFAAIVQDIATDSSLQGREYVRAPLDRDPDHERVYASFSRFDCVTFVETVLALAGTVAEHEQGFDAFAERLATLRYRSGTPGYCERLHYFTDWIHNNAAAGRIEDVTATVAGDDPANLVFAPQPQGLNFMSQHASLVPALADSPARLACIVQSEQRISALLPHNGDAVPGFAYIPKTRLSDVLPRLHGGDIVAWVADQPGLDVIHVGFVIQRAGQAGFAFAHASLRTGGVALAPDLVAYARSLNRQRGLIVLRPMSPSR